MRDEDAESALPWDDVADLHVVRRLGELASRRFGAPLGLARASGVPVAATRASAPCAEHAAAACRLAAAPRPADTPSRTLRYACPHHDGWQELAAPVRIGGALTGCVHGRALPGADLDLLVELLTLTAEEIAIFHAEIERRARAQRPAIESRHDFSPIIGRSRPMQELYRLLDKVVDSEATVLVQGENGTGKELIARAIHFNSRRKDERFVVQNCSAFNDNLLDSELFGHKKGSFTGAIADKQGLFEVADRGTFFLDEVGDMSPSLQVKLLRVLQEGTFTPVGDTQTRNTDVRIIAATHRDLKQMVGSGEFREDLYYRINVISVVVPPLRERRDDIPLLVEHFLSQQHAGTGRAQLASGNRRTRRKRLTRGCLDRLVDHAWPGNIRELENEIERLVVLSGDDEVIEEELLSPRIRDNAAPKADTEAARQAGSLTAAVDALEKSLIYEVLKRTQWNKTKAAQELRISRRNLIRKVDKYQLESRRK